MGATLTAPRPDRSPAGRRALAGAATATLRLLWNAWMPLPGGLWHRLLARLQADALASKARGDPAAAERHATAVAAMEAVRLDLLRLHGGGGSLDELTRDVEAARAIGERIDAELAARDAVRRLARAATPA